MSIRERVSSQQVLAVMLALIMLVSMSGMAFVGGAGAQTGGTFDGPIDQQEVVNNELAITDDGDVVLVGPGSDGEVDDVSVNPDGSIEIESAAGAGQFTGAALTPDRVDSLGDFSADPATEQADFLNESVGAFETDEGAPVIFADFDPQSDFSQINVDGNQVAGTHDYIAIGPAGTVDGLVSQDLSGQSNIVAVSIENTNDGTGDSTVLADAGTHGDVIETLVDDTNEQPVTNEYLENVLFGAGTVESTATISEVQLTNETSVDNFATGETVHSEKITLNPGADERFFNTINNANENASTNDVAEDVISVDRGTYDDLGNGNPVTLDAENVTLEANDRTNAGEAIADRVDEDGNVDDEANESVINAQVNVAAANVTVDGVVVQNSNANYVVTATGAVDGATLTNSIVDAQNTAVTAAVDFNPDSGAGEVSNNAILAANAEEFQGATGLNLGGNVVDLSDATIAQNLIVGFETQVATGGDVDLNTLAADHPQFADDPRAQAAVVSNDDDKLQGKDIYGSIALADDVAEDGDTITVVSGLYDEGAAFTIGTDDIELVGAEGAVVANQMNLNTATSVAVENIDFAPAAGISVDNDNDPDVSVTDVTLQADESNPSGTIDIDDATDVTVQDITVVQAANGGVLVNDPNTNLGEVTIEDVTITDLRNGATGVQVAATGPENNRDIAGNLTINNVAANGDLVSDEAATGITVDGIRTDVTGPYAYNITNNVLTGLNDGTGIAVSESDDVVENEGDEGTVRVESNELRGGTNFVGLNYDLGNTFGVLVGDNVIVGADVDGEANSIGINIEQILPAGLSEDTVVGIADPADGPEFSDNQLSDHARIVNVEADAAAGFSYDSFLGLQTFENGDDLNNEVGTLVTAEGDRENLGSYEDAYAPSGANDPLTDGDNAHYLPGSVDQALRLVETIDQDQDIEGVDSPTLQAYDPNVGINGANSNYVEGDEIVFPDTDGVTVTGQSEAVTVETRFTISTDSTQENNHNLTTLTIANANDAPAVTVDTTNAQTELSDLVVYSAGAGVDADGTDATDVNVIQVLDSEFYVANDADGIVLAGAADDRAGFIVERNTIESAKLTNTGTVGIDLSNVEKPGKQDPELDVQFSVADNTVSGFDIQANPGAGNFDDASGTFADVLTQNTFDEQVIIQNETGADATTNASLAAGGAGVVYGDIGTAVSDVTDYTFDGDNVNAVTINVPENTYDYSQPLTVGATSTAGDLYDNVTVEGDNAEISGTVVFTDAGTLEDLNVNGLDVVVDNDAVEPDAAIGDVTYTNTTDNPTSLDDYEVLDATVQDGTALTAVGITVDADPDGVEGLNDPEDQTLNVSDVSVSHDIDASTESFGLSPTDDVPDDAELTQSEVAELLDVTPIVTGTLAGDHGDVTFENVEVAGGDTTEAPTRGGITVNGAFATEAGFGDFDVANSTVDTAGDGIYVTGGISSDRVEVTNVDVTASPAPEPVVSDGDAVITYTDTLNETGFVTEINFAGTGYGVNAERTSNSDHEIVVSDSTIESTDAEGVFLGEPGEVYTGTATVGVELNNTNVNGASTGLVLDVQSDAGSTDLRVVDGSSITSASANATDLRNVTTTNNVVLQNSTFEGDTALFVGENVDSQLFNKNGQDLLGNAFLGDATAEGTFDIYAANAGVFDTDNTVALNYLGDDRGPFSSDAAGVYVGDEDFTYDPFLITPDVDSIDDATDTADFGHDVHLTGEDITTVAFPAQTPDGLTVSDVFDEEMEGTVYELNDDGSFTMVDIANNPDREIEAFDAFVVQNTGETAPALVAYDSDASNTDIATYEFEQGLNFVPATQAGDVPEALFPGGDTDAVQAPFSLPGNLYGTAGSGSATAADFATPADAGFGANFQSGDLDTTEVHPHAGYLVIVNEESNDGLVVSEQITKPAPATTDDIADRTDYSTAVAGGVL